MNFRICRGFARGSCLTIPPMFIYIWVEIYEFSCGWQWWTRTNSGWENQVNRPLLVFLLWQRGFLRFYRGNSHVIAIRNMVCRLKSVVKQQHDTPMHWLWLLNIKITDYYTLFLLPLFSESRHHQISN